jgi:hypothetical protein
MIFTGFKSVASISLNWCYYSEKYPELQPPHGKNPDVSLINVFSGRKSRGLPETTPLVICFFR